MHETCINCDSSDTEVYHGERFGPETYVEVWGCYNCETEWRVEFGNPIREEV